MATNHCLSALGKARTDRYHIYIFNGDGIAVSANMYNSTSIEMGRHVMRIQSPLYVLSYI